jgi:hypothetical protein
MTQRLPKISTNKRLGHNYSADKSSVGNIQALYSMTIDQFIAYGILTLDYTTAA